jgi:hypothetical protein
MLLGIGGEKQIYLAISHAAAAASGTVMQSIAAICSDKILSVLISSKGDAQMSTCKTIEKLQTQHR